MIKLCYKNSKGDFNMNLKNIIEKKDAAAQFMIDEITHIYTKFEKMTKIGGAV